MTFAKLNPRRFREEVTSHFQDIKPADLHKNDIKYCILY